jgi:hypothetical protein
MMGCQGRHEAVTFAFDQPSEIHIFESGRFDRPMPTHVIVDGAPPGKPLPIAHRQGWIGTLFDQGQGEGDHDQTLRHKGDQCLDERAPAFLARHRRQSAKIITLHETQGSRDGIGLRSDVRIAKDQDRTARVVRQSAAGAGFSRPSRLEGCCHPDQTDPVRMVALEAAHDGCGIIGGLVIPHEDFDRDISSGED